MEVSTVVPSLLAAPYAFHWSPRIELIERVLTAGLKWHLPLYLFSEILIGPLHGKLGPYSRQTWSKLISDESWRFFFRRQFLGSKISCLIHLVCFWQRGWAKNSRNDSLSRCDQFFSKVIQIGATLVTFGPFEVFTECPTVALTALDLPWPAPVLPWTGLQAESETVVPGDSISEPACWWSDLSFCGPPATAAVAAKIAFKKT